MTAALVVCCVGVALLLWPSTAPARRVERLVGASSDRRQRPRSELLAVVTVPVIGAVVGLGAGVAVPSSWPWFSSADVGSAENIGVRSAMPRCVAH